ncbi:MAG: flavodoxin, partial [Candidatus Heimdallarchaeota archaeon]|nr:flavodoxin [Candidatus Heimdallarchaeota archaeon]
NNTEKIANVFAKVLDAQIQTPRQVSLEEVQGYDLVGFGSGIYGDKHHRTLLELADKLPQVIDKKAFIFSTSALIDNATKHKTLKKKLKFKGYLIVDEFSCKGFNTNSFMKFFGGMNKGRPNAMDLKHAEEFAQNLLKL